jgi:hypothetical protein
MDDNAEARIEDFVAAQSIGAVLYQAEAFLLQLDSIQLGLYQKSACQIRDIFRAVVVHLRDRIAELRDSSRPWQPRQDAESVEAFLDHAHQLQKIHLAFRNVKLADAHSVPAALPEALRRMATNAGLLERVQFVVRAKWSYGCECVPLSHEMARILFPRERPHARHARLEGIWRAWCEEVRLPATPIRHFGALCFAGLDAHDSLLHPLLGHELGHLLDNAAAPPLHSEGLQQCLTRLNARLGDFSEFNELPPDTQEEEKANMKRLVRTFCEETMADLIGVRLFGLAFFVAHAEQLKVGGVWPENLILEDDPRPGYPGMLERVKVMRDELRQLGLDALCQQSKHALAAELRKYLRAWDERLARPSFTEDLQGSAVPGLILELRECLDSARKVLRDDARQCVPDAVAAVPTEDLWARTECLKEGRMPYLHGDSDVSLHEVYSASWLYELALGDIREGRLQKIADQYQEYQGTCRLLTHAVERIIERTVTLT